VLDRAGRDEILRVVRLREASWGAKRSRSLPRPHTGGKAHEKNERSSPHMWPQKRALIYEVPEAGTHAPVGLYACLYVFRHATVLLRTVLAWQRGVVAAAGACPCRVRCILSVRSMCHAMCMAVIQLSSAEPQARPGGHVRSSATSHDAVARVLCVVRSEI